MSTPSAPPRAAADALIIAQSRAGVSVEMAVESGSSVLEACDAHAAPLPFCCRSAACGSCRVEVLESADQLCLPQPDELELLQVFDADPKRIRLACQLRLLPGPARVRLRAVEE